MYTPRTTHLFGGKHILMYLRGTIDHGIMYHSPAIMSITVAYSNVDCPTWYAIFFEPISSIAHKEADHCVEIIH